MAILIAFTPAMTWSSLLAVESLSSLKYSAFRPGCQHWCQQFVTKNLVVAASLSELYTLAKDHNLPGKALFLLVSFIFKT
jgi:hypothetical protein